MHAAALRPLRAQFQLLSHRRAVKNFGLADVEVAAARANIHPAVIHLDLQCVAASFGGCSRNIAEQIKFILFLADTLQTTKKIVGVENRKSAGAIRQSVKNLLVGGSGFRELWNDRTRLIHGIGIVVTCWITSATATGTATSAATGRASGPTSAAFPTA